ncbi:MAG: hypothetical protein JXM69_00005 [Anaerolineae bacterium]|nr:hypothetical protein [Anaerolineae bacterium]
MSLSPASALPTPDFTAQGRFWRANKPDKELYMGDGMEAGIWDITTRHATSRTLASKTAKGDLFGGSDLLRFRGT